MSDPSHPAFAHYVVPYMFSTPLRSLVSKDLTNLFFAGRLASFSHVVFGSERVQKTCATMGQAVGTAAAYAVTHSVPPITLQDHPAAVWSIQQQLLRDDQFIIGLLNEDPRDHARNATVTASSETAFGPAANVLSGQSRAIVTGPITGHAGGVPPGQGKPGSNRWISESLPATLMLQLKAPVQLQQAEIVFVSAWCPSTQTRTAIRSFPAACLLPVSCVCGGPRCILSRSCASFSEACQQYSTHVWCPWTGYRHAQGD
jgi:hypothetical protein